MWVVQCSNECLPSERRISAERDSSNQRNTVLFRLFTLTEEIRGSAATASDLRGGSVGVKGSSDERNNCPSFTFCVYVHVSFMRAYRVCFYTWVYNPHRVTWALCSEQKLSIHVALLPTFIYVEAVTSRINLLFWRHLWFLLLSLFVNAIIFPLWLW